MTFSWSGRAEDRQQVELARDPAFNDIVAQRRTEKPRVDLPAPVRGRQYFFRYRSVEPDGFVEPLQRHAQDRGAASDWSCLWLLFPLLFGL